MTKLQSGQPGYFALSARRKLFKRILDVAVSSVGLTILAVPMLIVAAVVRLTSPGPALFKQTRVGLNRRHRQRRRHTAHAAALPNAERRGKQGQSDERRRNVGHGRPFTMYKFRTMAVDAEKGGAKFATQQQAYVTPVGKYMRKYRVDEWPQLFNILKGDMSLVGPRPERPEFVGGLVGDIPGYVERMELPPGLTGLAQVENGYDSEHEDFVRKAAYDSLYSRNVCTRNDLKILVRTVGVVVTGKGAV